MPVATSTGYTPEQLDKNAYGLTYDPNKIKAILDTNTAAQFRTEQNQLNQTQNQFYSNQYNTQASALDTIRKANAQAIANGASKGMQSANELSAILNLQQQGTQTATSLASQQNQLYDKEQAAYAQNAVNAIQQANTVGQNLYSADIQQNVGQMQYYAALEQALKNLQGVQYTADQNLAGTKYNADQNLSGVRYTADQNLVGTRYNADQNLIGTRYNADKNYAGTVYSADQNKAGQLAYAAAYQKAAELSANATKYAANTSAAAQKAAAAATGYGSTGSKDLDDFLKKAINTGGEAGKSAYVATLISQGMSSGDATASWNAATKAISSNSANSSTFRQAQNSAQSKSNSSFGQGWLFQ